jgi:hypothetical protein
MTTLTICVSFCVPALFQHYFSASVFAFVLQQFAFVLRQFTFVLQCVSASVLQKQPIAINDNLGHLRHLCCSHISNIIKEKHAAGTRMDEGFHATRNGSPIS